jgi:hypothetical protein
MDTRGSYDRWLRSSGIDQHKASSAYLDLAYFGLHNTIQSTSRTTFGVPAEHYHSTCTQKWISISTSIECIIAKISQVGRPVNTIHGTASNYVFLLLAVSPGVIKI